MNALLIVALLALNFGISWWNCYAVGGMWDESKHMGWFSQLLCWSAATQSVVGFSSVSLFLLGFLAHLTGYLPEAALKVSMNLWYLLVVIPALGTGLVLTIHSWIVAWRERSLANIGVAAYNTLAQASNMYDAANGGIADAFSSVVDFFKGDDDDESSLSGIVIALAVGSVLFGVVMTWTLINRYRGRLMRAEAV